MEAAHGLATHALEKGLLEIYPQARRDQRLQILAESMVGGEQEEDARAAHRSLVAQLSGEGLEFVEEEECSRSP